MTMLILAGVIGFCIGWTAERWVYRFGIRMMRRRDVRFDAAWAVMRKEWLAADERHKARHHMEKG